MSAILSLLACSALSELSAADELTLSATTGGEESLAPSDSLMTVSAVPANERPDPLRECDASGTYTELFGRFDANADGALDTQESDSVMTARSDRSDHDAEMVRGQWAMLLAVYDIDGNSVLDDSERATLFADFTERCGVLQAKLLADFDADGDGQLSDSEKDTARASLQKEMGAHGGDAEHGDQPGEDCDHAPPENGTDGDRPAAPAAGELPPPLVDEFDANSDGTLDDAELSTLRDTMRERIRSGAPLMPPPPTDSKDRQ